MQIHVSYNKLCGVNLITLIQTIVVALCGTLVVTVKYHSTMRYVHRLVPPFISTSADVEMGIAGNGNGGDFSEHMRIALNSHTVSNREWVV